MSDTFQVREIHYKSDVARVRSSISPAPPEKIEAGKKYPVILFLHGDGERGNDNKAQLEYPPLGWPSRK